MKRFVPCVVALSLLAVTASAQDQPADPGTTASPPKETPYKEAPKEEKKRSPYYKKVQGWLWIEGFAGASAYDPDRFGSLSLSGVPNAPKLNGPQFGFAVGTAFGGPFFLGAYYRQANYTDAPPGFGYKLMKVGLDMQGNLRFIPYVHPIFRLDIGYARTFSGNPYGLDNTDVDGLDFTLGAGLRIPLVRWMSFAATFDWSFVGLSVRGDNPNTGDRFQSWIGGQQFSATFALTFHFIGVRKN
jgi:hypothetical protein